MMGSTGKAGGGGVIRNHEKAWLKGFARPIGSTDGRKAELWDLMVRLDGGGGRGSRLEWSRFSTNLAYF